MAHSVYVHQPEGAADPIFWPSESHEAMKYINATGVTPTLVAMSPRFQNVIE